MLLHDAYASLEWMANECGGLATRIRTPPYTIEAVFPVNSSYDARERHERAVVLQYNHLVVEACPQ